MSTVINDVFLETLLDSDSESLSIERGIQILRQLDDAYFEDDPLVSDIVYDAFNQHIKQLDPQNVYFAQVGAEVRGGKIELPHQLGSLNQVEIGGVEDWFRKNKLKPTDMLVVTAKLDGASALGSFAHNLKTAYSRGDGRNGADITRHVKHFVKVEGFTGWVRAENIIRKSAFENTVKPNYMRSGGQPYKNPRNAVSGIMNASSHSDTSIYDHINYIAYDVLGNDLDKTAQLDMLSRAGFEIPRFFTVTVKDCSEELLSNFINTLRDEYDYEIDGVVVDVDSSAVRKRINEDNTDLNPKFAFKYKVADSSNYAETKVIRVEWNLSKNGYYKPRVIVEPVSLPGITWTYATGYNAKWILENGIGPGAIVGGQRMGDVVPNIIRIIKSVDAQMPDDFVWNHTGVDAMASNMDDHDEIWIMQLVHAVTSIGFPHLKEGSIRQLVDSIDTDSFDSTMRAILQMNESEWVHVVGANGVKIREGIREKMENMEYHIFVGSMPHFGRGVGRRKMKKIFEECGGLEEFQTLKMTDVVKIPGFEDVTAEKIVGGIPSFTEFYNSLVIKPTWKTANVAGDSMKGQSICITGFRDSVLEEWIESHGGKVQSGVSGATTILIAADTQSNSGKVKKANELNASGKGKIEIVTLDTFNKKVQR